MQHRDDVAAITATEIDCECVGCRRAEAVECEEQGLSRRSIPQFHIVGSPARRLVGFNHVRHVTRRTGTNKSETLTAGPLARFTVLDLTRVRAGPPAVRYFADWCATVITSEMPT